MMHFSARPLLFLVPIFCSLAGYGQVDPTHQAPSVPPGVPIIAPPGTNQSFGPFLCEEMADMVAALPSLKEYKQYRFSQNNCNAPARLLYYIFVRKDNPKVTMQVMLRDARATKDEGAEGLRSLKEEYQRAAGGGEENVAVSKHNVGQFGYVFFSDKKTVDEIFQTAGVVSCVSSFNCVFKDHYTFNIIVTNDPEASLRADVVDGFVKEYVSKINPALLK